MSKVLLLLLLVASSAVSHAQDTAGVLVEMASHAGVIFAGEVLSVAHHDVQGYVQVQFRVDSAVLGCTPGGTYTLREWSGRWAGHEERYRPGQRLLMLVTAAGPAGLSAPVYGSDGAIPIVAGTPGLLADVSSPAEPVVDLRFLATRVAPPDTTGTHTNLLIVNPVALEDAVWPALGNVLALLRAGAGA